MTTPRRTPRRSDFKPIDKNIRNVSKQEKGRRVGVTIFAGKLSSDSKNHLPSEIILLSNNLVDDWDIQPNTSFKAEVDKKDKRLRLLETRDPADRYSMKVLKAVKAGGNTTCGLARLQIRASRLFEMLNVRPAKSYQVDARVGYFGDDELLEIIFSYAPTEQKVEIL